jgi:malonyl-CoA/methylmalonyl-CoA synthetase
VVSDGATRSLLPLRAQAFGERPAVTDAGGTTTYAALLARSRAVAQGLLHRDADLREARVAILVTPGAAWVAATWGTWLAGGIAVPLSPQHPPGEWAYALEDADVSAVLADAAHAAAIGPLAADRGIPLMSVVPVDSTSVTAPGAAAPALPDIDADRAALILYTSGTTGRPKGVVHTHASLAAQVDGMHAAWGWRDSDHTLLLLPLHHVHGIVNVVCCALACGAHVTAHARFDADAAWRVLLDGQLTLLHAVPTIWSRLLAAHDAAPAERQAAMRVAVQRLRLIVSGSAALPVSVLERWRALTGHVLLERYGMTEIGMALSNPLDGSRVAGHVGLPLPGVEVRAVDDHGIPVAAGTAGELEVRGASVMRGYWRRPQETVDAFRDGWFRTGDIGLLDDTVGGPSWRLLGRRSTDIIKTGGYKVSALEIEEVLREHPAVAECAVVGVPDAEWGERVAAAFEVVPGATVTLDAVRDFLKPRLAVYKVPTAVQVVAALPRNAMGKVIKPSVAALFRADRADQGAGVVDPRRELRGNRPR